MLAEAHHKIWGDYRRHGAMVTFSNNDDKLKDAPLAGQHNAEILSAAGLTESEIEKLVENNILYSDI